MLSLVAYHLANTPDAAAASLMFMMAFNTMA